VTDDERQQLKDKIEQEIATLKKRLPGMREEAKPVPPDNAVGRLSRMEAIREQGVREKGVRDAEEKLQNLEQRLLKAASDDFDCCSTCRQPILFARLLYMPESDRCVGCAG
jgi:DnaK suppressor protein